MLIKYVTEDSDAKQKPENKNESVLVIEESCIPDKKKKFSSKGEKFFKKVSQCIESKET